jgi:ATP adenylyltransferase
MSEGVRRLWAPWRLAYIKKATGPRKPLEPKGCPFCELPRQEPSEETLVLYRDRDLFVIMNKFPYNPSHLLVVPRKHIGDPAKVPPAIWTKLSLAVQGAIRCLERAQKPQGFNVGMNVGATGGAGIPEHLHWHVLPRWNGDTNFMPLIAETKAIPTHNATVYRELKPFFADFEKHLRPARMKT